MQPNKMKTFLQNRLTLRFLQKDGSWLADENDAFQFRSSMDALKYCIRDGLMDMQIVLNVGARKHDVILPVR